MHLFLKGSSLSPYVSFRSNRHSYLLRCKSHILLRFRRVHILFESEIGSCPYFCKSRRGLLIAMVRQCKGGGYILINTMCFKGRHPYQVFEVALKNLFVAISVRKLFCA